MSKKYLIFGGILLIGITAILLKNNRLIKEKKDPTESKDIMQCKAETTSGQRCKRKTIPGKEFCWQHQN